MITLQESDLVGWFSENLWAIWGALALVLGGIYIAEHLGARGRPIP